VVAIAMTVAALVVVGIFFRRVRFHLRRARLTAADYYYSPII
jgi:hypothetical protein